MELKDFVSQTLFEISQGVYEANNLFKQVRGTNASNAFALGATFPGKGYEHTLIQFDVALTTKQETGVRGGIVVAWAGVGGKRDDLSESVSRVRFNVEVTDAVA